LIHPKKSPRLRVSAVYFSYPILTLIYVSKTKLFKTKYKV
jgi:hypothetical protein